MAVFLFPGQGSQTVGMGQGLFDEYRDLAQTADEILGYSIKRVCLEDTYKQLNYTQYTQPALYVVSTMTYLQVSDQSEQRANCVAGHSVGEYAALFAAGVFPFDTGLKLVQKRGELMSKARGGAMAAIIGFDLDRVQQILEEHGFHTLDIANANTGRQIVIAGPKDDIKGAGPIFERAGAKLYVPLNVSGAFHSRYMKEAEERFAEFVATFEFGPPNLVVLSNATGKPYAHDAIRTNLVKQISNCVRWAEIVQYLLDKGESEFKEMGSKAMLTEMVRQIRSGN